MYSTLRKYRYYTAAFSNILETLSTLVNEKTTEMKRLIVDTINFVPDLFTNILGPVLSIEEKLNLYLEKLKTMLKSAPGLNTVAEKLSLSIINHASDQLFMF